MTPEQALNVLAQVAAAHLCNKQDRMVIDQALQTLATLVTSSAPASEASNQPAAS